MKKFIAYTILLVFAFQACQKDDTGDPFDVDVDNQDTVKLNIVNPDPNSIAGIFQNVFRPTCANVGCHDGTFEPDFRTMESSYNTLLYQVPIKNNGSYRYRVEPYKPQLSVLMARLNNVVTPPMPIQIEPDSDWPTKGEEYKQNIINWINAGAPDINGNVRTLSTPLPVVAGAGAKVNGLWLKRRVGGGPIIMPSSAEEVDLFFAFTHSTMDPKDFLSTQISFSSDPNDFSSKQKFDLNLMSSPIKEFGFRGSEVDYTYMITVDPKVQLDSAQSPWYFRVYVQDLQNPVTEIPTDKGIYYVKEYMSYEWE